VFDKEFEEVSRAFFAQVQTGRFQLVISVVVRDEVVSAPFHVQQFFNELSGEAEVIAYEDQDL
jgi:hypothetical protein